MRLVDGRVVYAASDLNDYLACPHRVALNRRALLNGERLPDDDPTITVLLRKGVEHERRVLERLQAEGVDVVRVPEGDNSTRDLELAVEITRDAMRDGAQAIYQASFLDGRWMGRADFLMRVETPSLLGDWSYDVVDTKLATREKPRFLVQLCSYAELVAAVQGTLPRNVRAIFGDMSDASYDPERYIAFVREARRRFLATVDALDAEVVPDRIAACEECRWAERCDTARRSVDHLSLVAGIRRDQIKRFDAAGIATLERLATADDASRPATMVAPTFEALQRQARLQLHQRTTGELRYELLTLREQHGFAALPAPSDGDVYFDMEGDPLYEAGRGIEYLFGAFVPGDAERPYRSFWGETRDQERAAFEAFIDWLVDHRRRYPHSHVYHYAAYEKTALRKLAMRHGTREEQVDDLLRGEVLVDLYAVVRSALAQSQEGYSIKKLEAFYAFARSAQVRKGDQSIIAFEEYLLEPVRDEARKSDIIHYNEEDCISTHRLHAWLLRLREEAVAQQGIELEYRAQRDPHARRSVDVIDVDEEAQLVRIKRSDEAPHPRAVIPGEPFNTKVQRGALRCFAAAVLDGTVATEYPAAWAILNRERPRITGLFDGAIVQPPVRPGMEAIDCDDVADLALRLDQSALVVQGPPGTGKTYTGARVILALLAAGKRVGITSTGHKAINNLCDAVERAAVERGQRFRGVKKFEPKNEGSAFESHLDAPLIVSVKDNDPFAGFDLVAGTSWLMARDDLAPLDYLVVDEAGQVSLADVLAMSTKAKNVILLGDPLQLAHVSLGTHPGGAAASVLEHLLSDTADVQRGTVPPDRGVFLNRTFRMHPALCEFLSDMVYEGRLRSAASCERQRIDAPWFSGAGLRYVPVDHELNAQSSEEEAAAVEQIVAGLVGGTFTDRFGERRPLRASDILIVSPYNAQVRLLQRTLRRRFGDAVRVGTVDKFQGQEAPAVIYSLAASSTEDAPRGADFLFEENRFNVALSRGRALAVLVCSPALLAARCTTVEQLRAVATFCAFKEAAAAQGEARDHQARRLPDQIPLFN